MMRLAALLTGVTPTAVSGLEGDGPEVRSLHYRSQDVRPGGVLGAVRGSVADGHDFVADALARGAAALVVERPVAAAGTAVLQVPDTRRALAELAAAFYGRPSEGMTVVAVTGTNGKTTTTYLIESILEQAGHPTGVVGTINYRYAGRSFPNPVTTPESLDLQRILADMRSAGVRHAVLEASSHAIQLARIHACRMDVAVFTNLSQDHLDFHGDMPAYWAVKQALFTEHLRSGPKADQAVAVVNTDHAHGRELAQTLGARVVRVGTAPDCDVCGEDIACSLDGIRGALRRGADRVEFASPLVGRHNIENILCAAGAALALGIRPDAVGRGIADLSCVPGRLERVANGAGIGVYVDYSHTPDALENALRALRALTSGRLICVFGCGGDRDRKKRPIMGAIAARLSDLAVVTSDNPRSEPPQAIIDEILPGLRREGVLPVGREAAADRPGYVDEPDRRRAIATGIGAARPGDAVLIAGKGHETYQVIGARTVHFDDREEAARVLAGLPARKA
jgi:UDP-N-acetylmuramyl-tripeptide synthetase